MLIKRTETNPISSSEITPKSIYLSRRGFLKAAGLLIGGAVIAGCSPTRPSPNSPAPSETPNPTPKVYTDELGDPATSENDITNYNNYYEFSTNKAAVAPLAKDFVTKPWQVSVSGLVGRPKTYDLDELITKFQPEDRIYRLRCVEGWSMVIPWVGFSLAKLLKEVEPTSDAKYVRFVTLDDFHRLPRELSGAYPWPYQEGLRIDEAFQELTLLATGLYGGDLPAQNGGGLRLVVPWKYGFKSIKAIVKIECLDKKPETMWNTISPREYGFYANVNPNVPHPRWPQSTERRIGVLSRRDTPMFNGYADQVSSLYTNLDLAVNY